MDQAVSSALRELGQTQQRLLRHLQRDAGGASVVALSEALGVSHNAVRQHLTALAGQGYVERGAAVPTGGRPEHLYVLTEAGRELFPRRYVELAAGIIREVGATLGESGLEKMLMRLGDDIGANMAKQWPSQSVAERTEAVAVAMNQLGYDAEARVDSRVPEIRARNCVFHHLASEHPAVCRFDLALLARASGRRVEHAECMVRGGTVCRFRFLPGSGIDPIA